MSSACTIIRSYPEVSQWIQFTTEQDSRNNVFLVIASNHPLSTYYIIDFNSQVHKYNPEQDSANILSRKEVVRLYNQQTIQDLYEKAQIYIQFNKRLFKEYQTITLPPEDPTPAVTSEDHLCSFHSSVQGCPIQ